MDIFTPLVPGHARWPNKWTRARLDQPKIDMGSICTTREVALGAIMIISFADGPPTLDPPTNFWEVLRKWQRMWMWDNLQWVGGDH